MFTYIVYNLFKCIDLLFLYGRRYGSALRSGSKYVFLILKHDGYFLHPQYVCIGLYVSFYIWTVSILEINRVFVFKFRSYRLSFVSQMTDWV
jgi:hypothetical protein